MYEFFTWGRPQVIFVVIIKGSLCRYVFYACLSYEDTHGLLVVLFLYVRIKQARYNMLSSLLLKMPRMK